MLKFLFKLLAAVAGLAILLGIMVVLAAPYLVPTDPAPGVASGRELATPDSRFARIPFAGTDGLEVHYLARGTGAPTGTTAFLLLHGFTFNAFTWVPVLDTFGAHGRTFAYDQLPYGLSAKPQNGDWSGPDPYSKEAAIAQLFAFMDSQGVEKAVLVGNSSGGTLALDAALARPERVSGLILVAPWVYVTRPTLPDPLAALPQMQRLGLLAARKLGQSQALLELSYARPDGIVAARRELYSRHTRMAGWDLAWGELLALSLSTPVTVSARLNEIRVPALVISGDLDRVVPVADSMKAAEQLPQATFALLDGCGHVPQEECPAEFDEIVADWLRAQGFAAAPDVL